MAFEIFRASSYKIEKDSLYFLDANIWIFILAPKNKPANSTQHYIKLFEDILNEESVKIVVPAMLISEVVNRILRDVSYDNFLHSINTKRSSVHSRHYKDVFRPSAAFKDAYEVLVNDFVAYSDSIKFVDDGFGVDVSTDQILDSPPTSLDFNDNYYYSLAISRGYKIITDDGDFWTENLKIITQNAVLLEKQNQVNIANYAARKR